MVNFKFYGVTNWTTNSSNTHVAQYLKKKRQPNNEIGSMGNIFFEKSYTKCGGEASPRPFYKKSKFSYLWIKNLKCYIACFCCMSRSRSTEIY